jgi:3-oxoacyl-[acyl-carrier protein] reductase
MSKLAEKVALVTGGSRGIGAAIAKRLAADGASVAFTYAKDAGAASAVVKAIELAGGKAVAIQADAANVEAVRGAVEKAVATFGRLDVLVNSAGTAIPKSFEETTLEEMDRVIDINLRGVLATTQAALKHMNDGGRIIMIGSAVGERAVAPGLVPYAATKGAVKMFTQALSREVGSRGITVNNVQPGPIDTDLNPASGDWAVPQKANEAGICKYPVKRLMDPEKPGPPYHPNSFCAPCAKKTIPSISLKMAVALLSSVTSNLPSMFDLLSLVETRTEGSRRPRRVLPIGCTILI